MLNIRLEYDKKHDTIYLYTYNAKEKKEEIKSYINEENVYRLLDTLNKILEIVNNDNINIDKSLIECVNCDNKIKCKECKDFNYFKPNLILIKYIKYNYINNELKLL